MKEENTVEEGETEEERLTRFKSETAIDYDATEDQRDASDKDMRFCNVIGGMWEGWLENTHGSDTNRAMMEFDIISDYKASFVGEWTLNRANVTYEAADDKTSEDDADLINGIYRADFNDSDGQIAQDNGVDEMAECGIGAFKLSTQFEDDDDPENENQDIIFEPKYNAYNHVIWDSNAKRIDKADAKRCTELTTYTKKAFKEEFPESEPISAYEPDNRGFTWNTPELITVAARYDVKKEKITVHVYENLELGQVNAYEAEDIDLIKDELSEEGWEFVRERVLERPRVYKTIFTGAEIIEDEKLIAGRFIPIIPLYGFRKFIDGQEHVYGLVRKLKDANRLINANISRMAESGASSGDSVPIFTAKQIEGLERNWADKTKGAYQVINDLEDANGNLVPSSPVGYLQPNQVDPNTIQTTELVSGFVDRKTGQNREDIADHRGSEGSLREIKKKINLNTQILSDNIITAIKHSGKVYRAILADITTSARSKRSLEEDGTAKIVKLNNHVMDQETGQFVVGNDLSKGKYAVNVVVGPQYESQKEATMETIERIIEKIAQVAPDYIPPLIGSWVSNIDGPGLESLKKFNRNKMIMAGHIEAETDEEKAMVEQAGQQTNPQDELAAAAKEQQLAEAANLMASAEQKKADTQKKKAETAEIVVDIGAKRAERMLQRFQN